jgi:4,5-DOPA dioxygenase extradiol
MHALEPGAAGHAWEALGRALPRPRALLIASAHWETSLPMVTGNAKPETIHDFTGFPAPLYALRYPAPGAPELAARAVAPHEIGGHHRRYRRLQGTRPRRVGAVLYMYPAHDIPIAQVSLSPALGPSHHVALGRALAPLTREGVLVIGSGHMTHNLRDWNANRRRTEPLAYAATFTDWIAQALVSADTEALVDYRERAPDAARAHPSEEHFLPLHVAWGAAGDAPRAERVFEGFEGGALALDAWLFH